jgi:hypothetical protein
MSARQETKDIAGIFETQPAAAEAVKRLVSEHFGACNELSVIVSNRHEREAVPVTEPIPAYESAAIGTALGAFLAGVVVAIAGMDSGPFTLVEWGPLWAIFEAAFTGGSVGFAVGALMSIEGIHKVADFSGTKMRDGVVWVGVSASGQRAERAREILAEAGAKHIMERKPEGADSYHFGALAA